MNLLLALPAPDLTVYTKSRFGPGAPPLSRAEKLELLERLVLMTREERRSVLRGLPEPAVRALAEEWWWQAHGGQVEPEACEDGKPWRVWTIMAGRGFGKTRAGAEWVWARAREDCKARIALVGATIDEVERVMVKGESGLLETARGDERPHWLASKGLLLFPSGAEGHAFSAERPDKLRGPQHHHAWCDELAKWPRAEETWNNLMLGLRLGDRPRTIVTTTPKPVPMMRRLLDLPRSVTTQGRSDDNPHRPADIRSAMKAMFAGTRVERQELDGLLLEEFEGALWSRALLDKWRDPTLTEAEIVGLARIVVGVDPPASTRGDSCGIVVCGRDRDGICRVLADLSAPGLSPEAWARRVCEAASLFGAGRVVAEKNQGGEMISSNLRAVDADLPVRLVHAGPSKAARAEPIALRFETGRARLAGFFPELEDQLCALTWQGFEGPGSPDRADAMVWAMTELFAKERAPPRIRTL